MTQGTGSDGHDPYQEKLDRYWAWIRGRAWLLALVLTVLGDLVLIAHPEGRPRPRLLAAEFPYLPVHISTKRTLRPLADGRHTALEASAWEAGQTTQ